MRQLMDGRRCDAAQMAWPPSGRPYLGPTPAFMHKPAIEQRSAWRSQTVARCGPAGSNVVSNLRTLTMTSSEDNTPHEPSRFPRNSAFGRTQDHVDHGPRLSAMRPQGTIRRREQRSILTVSVRPRDRSEIENGARNTEFAPMSASRWYRHRSTGRELGSPEPPV